MTDFIKDARKRELYKMIVFMENKTKKNIIKQGILSKITTYYILISIIILFDVILVVI